MSRKTPDELVIMQLKKIAAHHARKREQVERWGSKQFTRIAERKIIMLAAIETVESAEFDTSLDGYTAEKADRLLIAAEVRVDSGIETVSGNDKDGPNSEQSGDPELEA